MTDLRLILPVTGRLRWIVICTAVTVRAISARPEASPQATARWCGSCMLPGGPDPPAPIGGPGSSSARAHTLRPGGPGDLPTVALARGPHSARRARPRGAQLQLGLQPAKRAAGGRGPTPGRCCGLGQHASPLHRTGDWARVPARTVLAGMLVTDPQTRAACASCMLRYQARQLRWRTPGLAAASSGLVSARPTLLGASFACDIDPSVSDATQVRRRDATCRKLRQMREFNADICAKL